MHVRGVPSSQWIRRHGVLELGVSYRFPTHIYQVTKHHV
jgi:hypothetical protein